MPLTASKTDAETNATTRLVASGLVPPAITVVFMIPIHSSTGSGGVAAETGKGLAASSATITISIAFQIVAPAPGRKCDRKTPRWDPVSLRIMHPPQY